MEINIIFVYNNNMRLFCIIFCIANLYCEIVTYSDISNIVINECKKYPSKKVNQYIIRAMLYYESRVVTNTQETFNTEIISSKNCVGLMQISDIALLDYNNRRYNYYKRHDRLEDYREVKKKNLLNSRINLHIGIWVYAKFLDDAQGNMQAALNRYSHNAKNYNEKVCMKALDYMIKEYKK